MGAIYKAVDNNGVVELQPIVATMNEISGFLPGSIMAYAAATVPANYGWLLCNGQAVSRTTYSALFEAIGTTYGAGDGSTTFNVPDLRGEFLRGAGTNSHANQGNGGTVGQHQDATYVNSYESPYAYNGDSQLYMEIPNTNNYSPRNYDFTFPALGKQCRWNTTVENRTNPSHGGTVRPTNTSVNYIIKY